MLERKVIKIIISDLHLITIERKIQKSYGSHGPNLVDWPYKHGHPTYNNTYIILNSLLQIMVGISSTQHSMKKKVPKVVRIK